MDIPFKEVGDVLDDDRNSIRAYFFIDRGKKGNEVIQTTALFIQELFPNWLYMSYDSILELSFTTNDFIGCAFF